MVQTKTEIQLIHDLARGEMPAFDHLYHKYHPAVFANISKLIQQSHFAEDILQEVFICLWENREKIDASQDVAGWLFVVSYNKSIAFLKKRVREKTYFPEDFSDLIITDENQTCDISELHLELLNEAINLLSPRKKKVFELCRLQGKTYAEAASLLGISPATIKDYMKESLKFIREFMLSNYSDATAATIFLLALYLHP